MWKWFFACRLTCPLWYYVFISMTNCLRTFQIRKDLSQVTSFQRSGTDTSRPTAGPFITWETSTSCGTRTRPCTTTSRGTITSIEIWNRVFTPTYYPVTNTTLHKGESSTSGHASTFVTTTRTYTKYSHSPADTLPTSRIVDSQKPDWRKYFCLRNIVNWFFSHKESFFGAIFSFLFFM